MGRVAFLGSGKALRPGDADAGSENSQGAPEERCGGSIGGAPQVGGGLGQMEEEEKCLVTFSPASAAEDVGC